MSWRSDSSQLFAGKWTSSAYAGQGVQAQSVPATGDSGPSFLFNDIAAQGMAPTDEVRGEILTWPSAGTLAVNEDSSFSFTGAPDGTYTFTYRGFINGVSYGDHTVTLIIGDTDNSSSDIDFSMPQMSVAISGNVVAVGNSASIAFAMPQMIAAASASSAVPVFDANVSAVMPQFAVSVAAGVQSLSIEASLAFSMPQMQVSISGSSVAPTLSASVSFTMPQFTVQAFSGGLVYYESSGAHIEYVAQSTHLEYINQSTHIEWRA